MQGIKSPCLCPFLSSIPWNHTPPSAIVSTLTAPPASKLQWAAPSSVVLEQAFTPLFHMPFFASPLGCKLWVGRGGPALAYLCVLGNSHLSGGKKASYCFYTLFDWLHVYFFPFGYTSSDWASIKVILLTAVSAKYCPTFELLSRIVFSKNSPDFETLVLPQQL